MKTLKETEKNFKMIMLITGLLAGSLPGVAAVCLPQIRKQTRRKEDDFGNYGNGQGKGKGKNGKVQERT